MFGKQQRNRQPKLAGLDEIDLATSETDVPVPYFAGFRKLDISWVMNAVISRTTNSDSSGKGGKSGKSGGGSKNYFGHCAGKSCQGQIDFLAGLIVNNELVWPDAEIWDSKIFKAKRVIIYTDGNAYKITVETDQVPPNFPWTLYAIAYVAGSYANGDLIVNAGFVFQSKHGANVAAPPAIAADNADWKYLSTPEQWAVIGANHFWPANSIVAWEGVVYETPADTNAQPPNAPWVKFRVLRSASPNPLKTTVAKNSRFGQNAGPGDWYHYWGTPDQVLDVAGEAILNALGHPPYRNNGVTMGKSVLFGTQTVTPPTAQILAGRSPVQALIIDNTAHAGVDATALDPDWQVNLWTVVAELLTHQILGLGIPLSWFDAASWQAEADRCAANASLFYISPLFTSLKKINEIVAELLSYADSFIYWTPAGTIAAGHWPHGEAAPVFDATNTINRNNVTKEFDSNSDGWWGTLNSITVSVQDIQAGFKSRPATAPNSWNMAVTRRLLSQTLDRPHITRFAQGVAWATEFAKIGGDQSDSGTFEVQAEKASAIRAGSNFLFTDDVLQTSEPQRCTQRVISAPPTGTVKLTRETERGLAPQPFSPTPVNPTQAIGPSPAVVQKYALVQLPTELIGSPNNIAVLAGRQNDSTSALQVWFRQADGTAFQQLGTNGAFAVPGVFEIDADGLVSVGSPSQDNTAFVHLGAVTQGNSYDLGDVSFWKYQVFYSVNSSGIPFNVGAEGTDYTIDPLTGTLTIITGGNIPTGYFVNVRYWNTVAIAYDPNTPSADLDAIMAALTEDEINDGDLLLFAVQAADPSLFEIMSVRSVVAVGTDIVTGLPVLFLKVWRAQFGTQLGGDGSYDFGTNADTVFITKRSQITPLTHTSFAGLSASSSTAAFILAPQSAWVTADISDLFDAVNNPSGLSTEFDYTFENHYTPTVQWIQQQQNGANIASFAGAFLTTDALYFSFQINSPQTNIVGASLTAQLGEQQLTLWAQNYAPSSQQNAAVAFSLTTPGLWTLFVNVLCADGNQVSYPLTLVGSATPVQMQVNTPAATFAPTPIIASKTVIGRTILQLKFGKLPSGLTVNYQLQPRGTALNPAGWTAAGALSGGLYGPVPQFLSGSKTLYAYCHIAGSTDSQVVSWNF